MSKNDKNKPCDGNCGGKCGKKDCPCSVKPNGNTSGTSGTTGNTAGNGSKQPAKGGDCGCNTKKK